MIKMLLNWTEQNFKDNYTTPAYNAPINVSPTLWGGEGGKAYLGIREPKQSLPSRIWQMTGIGAGP